MSEQQTFNREQFKSERIREYQVLEAIAKGALAQSEDPLMSAVVLLLSDMAKSQREISYCLGQMIDAGASDYDQREKHTEKLVEVLSEIETEIEDLNSKFPVPKEVSQ